MENEHGTVVELSGTKRRKTPARKGASARRPRKPAARKKTSARRRTASRSSFKSVIRSITAGAEMARAAIAEASGQGAGVVRRTFGRASTASKKTITRLAREWKAMDPKQKAGVLAALLGAAAAATAPIVRRRFKK